MNAKINVMLLNAPITIGGAEKVVLMLLTYLNREQFRIKIGSFVSYKRPNNIFVKEITKQDREPEILWMHKTFDFRNIRQLRDVLTREKIQVLHTHGYRSDIIGYLATRKMNIPIVTTAHGWTPINNKLRLYEWLDRRFLRYFDRIICVSDKIQNDLLDNGIPPDKLIRLNNAVDVSQYSRISSNGKSHFCDTWKIPPDSFLIGTVSRLTPEKGHKYLVEAFAKIIPQFPQVRLVLVGDGPEQGKLERQTRENGISDKVIFCGFQQAIEQYYSAFDLVVLPSIMEGMPISLLEAIAYGKPIIATAVGGIPDLIIDQHSGLLVPPQNIDALSQSLLWAMQHSEAMQIMQQRARQLVSEKYGIANWIKKMERIYLNLIEN